VVVYGITSALNFRSCGVRGDGVSPNTISNRACPVVRYEESGIMEVLDSCLFAKASPKLV
jgi:hypothetical protein